MLKTAIKSFLSHSCRWLGTVQTKEREFAENNALGILCLHRILPEPLKSGYFAPDLVVTPQAFERLCATLARHYEVLPLAEALQRISEPAGKRPLMAITFDDGYRDNLIYAAPILEKYQLPATFYVVSEFIGTPTPPWYDHMAKTIQQLREQGHHLNPHGERVAQASDGATAKEVVAQAKTCSPNARRERLEKLLQQLDKPLSFPPEDLIMDWSDLQTLTRQGHEIGSHSCTHEILPLLDDQQVIEEISHSKATLEKGLGQTISSFCFPNGDYDHRCLDAIHHSDYSNAVTTLHGLNNTATDSCQLKRIFIHEGRLCGLNKRLSPTITRVELSGLGDRLFRKTPATKTHIG